jgi:outer membrane protein
MKTKITLFIALLFIGFSMNAQQTKVGTVDSDYILAKMPQLKTVQDRLKKYGAKLDSINAIKIKDYDTKVKAFNDASKTLPEAEKKTKYAEIAKLNQDIGKFRQNGSQMMQLRRDEFLRPLYKKIAEVVEQVAKEKGYTQILTSNGNQFAYIDQKHDITKLVLAKMGIKE